jgi:hypothetical protein
VCVWCCGVVLFASFGGFVKIMGGFEIMGGLVEAFGKGCAMLRWFGSE